MGAVLSPPMAVDSESLRQRENERVFHSLGKASEEMQACNVMGGWGKDCFRREDNFTSAITGGNAQLPICLKSHSPLMLAHTVSCLRAY